MSVGFDAARIIRATVRVVGLSGVAQLVGLLMLCVAVGVLAGVWWAVGFAGLMLLAGGTLAERAQVGGS